ncbi:serine/threonine-protein kinase haspin [Dermacentor silvarum]|uniref:serine/threonine-protein kinase haspin n=1 Tax=Dermacentor silvarum TaxID=543639 RepID=UPI001899878F|nr:serine/threonine-protein kinase haspin [Dermacentor silvarum]
MVRLFGILVPVFCIACTASMAKGSARRDDGYDGGSVPEPNTYRYSIVNGDEYKQALKKPSHPALRYMLDITNERITYNKSIVKSRADRHRLQVKDTLRLPKTNLRTHTTATSTSTDSFESLAITKHTKQPTEADCCYQVTNMDPWLPLLALCKRSKPVDFLNVIHEDCQATKLSWDEPGGGDVFRVLGSQGDQLVRVLRLREREVPWHTSRLRVARELSNLKNSVDNRTSAFFVDARASLVRDIYPRLLSSAQVHQDDQFLLCSAATSPEERAPVAEYLVTEIQPGWRPLPNYKLNNPNQALSVLGQACWALAVAEAELEFEHRLPVVGAVLVRPTKSPRVEFTLRGHIVRIPSAGIKVRLQGLQLARIRIGTHIEFTDVTRFPEFVRAEDEVAVCARIADLLNKRPTKFEPRTNVLWLQHLADWLELQYAEDSSVLSHWQGVLAASCSAEHATVGSRHTSTPSGTPPT